MKLELEQHDIEAIAKRVTDALKPLLANNGRNEEKDTIFNVGSLAEYLKVNKPWIYTKTHLKEIPHYKIEGTLRFRKTEIDKWLSSYNVPSIV